MLIGTTGNIDAGADWKQVIDSHLNTAGIILLLVSPNFIASDYCYNIETQRALERHAPGECRVIPVFLCSRDWKGLPFGATYQAALSPVGSSASVGDSMPEIGVSYG